MSDYTIRVFCSRTLNRCTGGDPEQLFCTRVHHNRKHHGGVWIAVGAVIDITFYVVFREKEHVRASYLWDYRNR